MAGLEAALRPLRFAARSGAAAGRVHDLEATVQSALAQVTELSIPPDLKESLGRLSASLEVEPGVDGAGRAARLAAAEQTLAAWAEPAWGRQLLERTPEVLPGVGPRRAAALARRGLRTIGDLLFHLPTRYDDRSRLSKIGELQVGLRATFVGEVQLADFVRRGRGGRMFQAVLGDGTGTVNLKWFRAADGIKNQVKRGEQLLVTGDVKRFRFSKEIVHPEVSSLQEGADPTAGLGIVADYGALEGVAPRTLRNTVESAVEHYVDLAEGWLPDRIVAEHRLPDVATALATIHRPARQDAVAELIERRDPAFRRLILEELYLLEVGLVMRQAHRRAEPGIALALADADARALESRLPFELTRAQRRAWGEIRADLARPHPMNRLLQGDVGSGKTAVAWLAASAAAAAGHQSALMAPTELLAEQHARTLRALGATPVGESAAGSALRFGLLTASQPRPVTSALLEAAAKGDVDCLVGTHALVQQGVRFARLGLTIVDEQHRFGVLQRAALTAKGAGGLTPHGLVMTATPIPRTLALTLYGDLDLSVIDELPPGRSPIVTDVLRDGEGQRVLDLLRETIDRGGQAYVVYPLVEETERSDLRAATEQAARIQAALPDATVALVHGRLDATERAEVMRRFDQGETQVLVSTTVVEVGVDVPTATLMIVEHAERFGLAQLHQLRGRVGRGAGQGTCLLLARGSTADSEARLRAMLETQDGFRIADADLRIRGPGEFLGTRQHGKLPDLRIADLLRDARWVAEAREAALATVRADPALEREPELFDAVRRRWGERLDLAGVG
ncbi:MAG: ATP-dependent DNA helicase RecG [Myxococcales bacterium]|nr:ATP-dependent DNA helicase RecG [Myxococcales bacterium]